MQRIISTEIPAVAARFSPFPDFTDRLLEAICRDPAIQ